MSIQTNCPACQTAYQLADNLSGKRVRCRTCAETFLVGGVPPAAADDVPVLEEVEPGDEPNKRRAPARSPRAGAEDERLQREPRPARRPRVEDDRPRRRSAAPRSRKPYPSLLPWLLIGGGVLLLLLLALGTTLWLVLSKTEQATAGNSPPQVVMHFPPDPFGNNPPPVPGPPAGRKMLDVQPAPFAPPVAFGNPKDIDEALTQLKDPQVPSRLPAVIWLTTAAVNEGRRAEVARALEGLLDDPFIRVPAIQALARWTTRESVPVLIRALESDDAIVAIEAGEILGKLKDERASVPLAKQLLKPAQSVWAANALIAMGPAAEKAVLPYLTNEDRMVRREVIRVLAEIGTPAAIPALKQAGTGDRITERQATRAIQRINSRK
jgi:predicted Zn finger-like uncharacterized protein